MRHLITIALVAALVAGANSTAFAGEKISAANPDWLPGQLATVEEMRSTKAKGAPIILMYYAYTGAIWCVQYCQAAYELGSAYYEVINIIREQVDKINTIYYERLPGGGYFVIDKNWFGTTIELYPN